MQNSELIISKRNYALDLMKFAAAIMITNSHFQPLYKDINEGLATFGVHGNALFFFVAGFLLMSGFKRKKVTFANWYKMRMQRLWPSVFLWISFAALLLGSQMTWQKCFLFSDYWFLQCIVVYYAVYYLFCSMPKTKSIGGGVSLYLLSVIVAFAIALILPKSQGSIFHSDWRYTCHLSAMLLGGICSEVAKEQKKMKSDWIICLVSFVAYFIVLKYGKGRTDYIYYTQIVGLLPLHIFLWYFYKVCNRNWVAKLMNTQITGKVVQWISALTLEIYVVQFHIISDRWNALFPMNIVIVFFSICIAAYILRISVNIFLQFLSKEDWNKNKIFSI